MNLEWFFNFLMLIGAATNTTDCHFKADDEIKMNISPVLSENIGLHHCKSKLPAY